MRYLYLVPLLIGFYFATYFTGAFSGHEVLMNLQHQPEEAKTSHWYRNFFNVISFVFSFVILYYNYWVQKKLNSRLDKLQSSIEQSHFLAYNRAMEPD